MNEELDELSEVNDDEQSEKSSYAQMCGNR